jgi:hypothetical protein
MAWVRTSTALISFRFHLYHLNAEEEPEELDDPGRRNPEYLKELGPRGVRHAWASDMEDPAEDPRFRTRRQEREDNRDYRRADPQAHGDARLRDARAQAAGYDGQTQPRRKLSDPGVVGTSPRLTPRARGRRLPASGAVPDVNSIGRREGRR